MMSSSDTENESGDINAPNYKPPEKRSLKEIQEKDAEDESLRRYKEALLGDLNAANNPVFPDDPRIVIFKSFHICVDGQPKQTIDLTTVNNSKPQVIKVPEKANYHIEFDYYVQREIVTGLTYKHKVKKGPIPAETLSHVLGSYGPQKDLINWKSDSDQAPGGITGRGTYSVKSRFFDEYKQEFIKWNWILEITKA